MTEEKKMKKRQINFTDPSQMMQSFFQSFFTHSFLSLVSVVASKNVDAS